MLRSIINQLWNRRKSNGWILLELLLVFCLTWYIVDYFFVIGYNYIIPSHQDLGHTWQVNIRQFPPDHPAFIEEESTPEAIENNYRRILNNIRNYRGVENVAINFDRSYPGSGSFGGSGFYNPNDSTSMIGVQRIIITSEEDYFSVFRNTANNGETHVSTRDFNWNIPNPIILDRQTEQLLFNGGSAKGQTVANQRGDIFHVAGVVDNVKRFPFGRIQTKVYLPERLSASTMSNATISVRVDASLDEKQFLAGFSKEMISALRAGNFYITNIRSYSGIESEQVVSDGLINEIRIRFYVLQFFLVNILLCMIGTFWYRIHVRREEIGLRIALGSSRCEIRNLLIAEGLLLLTIVTLPAMIIEFQFVHAGLIETFGKEARNQFGYLVDKTLLRFLITNIITWLIIATVITLSIWIPAYKASTVMPAESLHYE